MKPRLFIGCSSEALHVANAIQTNLDCVSDTTVWAQGIFRLSQTPMESLETALAKFDFAAFVFAPDDVSIARERTDPVVRDNVILEFGLFCGRLGRRRCFIVSPRGLEVHFPSDLLGIVTATYDPRRSDLIGALGPASSAIGDVMRSLGPIKRSQLTEKDTIDKAWQRLITGATKSIRIFSGDSSWASRDAEVITCQSIQGIRVRILCEAPRDHPLVKDNLQSLITSRADVRVYDPELPLRTRGLLVDSERPDECIGMIISRTPKSSTLVPEGKPGADTLYAYSASWLDGQSDAHYLDVMHRLFEAHYALGREALVLKPITIRIHELLRVLASVPQYSGLTEGRVAFKHLDVNELYSSCAVVKRSKLVSISHLVSEFEMQALDCFETVICSSRRYSGMLLPPIVEYNEGKYVIVDGIHRLFERAIVMGKQTTQCLVLEVNAKLPGDPIKLRNVRIVPEKLSRDRIFHRYNSGAFRRIKDIYRALEQRTEGDLFS